MVGILAHGGDRFVTLSRGIRLRRFDRLVRAVTAGAVMFLGLLALGFGWERTRERNFGSAVVLLFVGFWLTLCATRMPYAPEWAVTMEKSNECRR